ncbi:MAG TPA: hypothetical protein VGM85_06215, partial [Paraburkholderia sp.]
VLGPLVEENFRRALLLSDGRLGVFFEHPISAVFISASILLVLLQVFFALRRAMRKGPDVDVLSAATGLDFDATMSGEAVLTAHEKAPDTSAR